VYMPSSHPWYMPPCPPLVGSPPPMYGGSTADKDHSCTRLGVSMCTFSLVVEERRVLGGRKCLFSPQEITSSSQETGLKAPTIPLQKAPAHKDTQNNPTPPQVSSRPPQGKTPPFHPVEVGGTPGSWALFLANC